MTETNTGSNERRGSEMLAERGSNPRPSLDTPENIPLMHGRCPYRDCVHDRRCTLQSNWWNACHQVGYSPVRCSHRNHALKKLMAE
jgi:hypothetical protein